MQETKSLIIFIIQNRVLVSKAKLFEGKVVKATVNDHVVRHVGSLEIAIKASGSWLLMGMDNLILQVGMLATLAIVPKRLTNLWSGGV